METRSKLIQRNRLARLLHLNSKNHSRKGYSLVEMSLALMLSAIYLGGLMFTISTAVNWTLKADQRTIALALAQAKMSQLLNNPNLTPTNTEYKKIEGSGIYNNYRWKLKINEDKINLADVAKTGKISVDVGDKIPAGIQNQSTKRESAGSSTTTQTGGDIEIMRIVVMIKPPKSSNIDFVYRVSTFQPIRKTKSAGGF